MNWGGFAGGFAQGFNQTFDAKGISRYMLSPEYRQAKIMEQAAAEASAPDASAAENAPNSVGVTGKPAEASAAEPAKVESQPAATTPPPVEAAGATTPGNPAPETATPVSGIKAIVSDQTAAQTTPQSAPEATTPAAQPVTQQAIAQNGGIAVAQPQTKPQPAAIDSQLQKTLAIARRKYAEAGDLENAEKLDKYIQSERGKAATKTFSDGWNALTVGNDVNKAVQKFGEYYTKYVNDGIDFTKGEITKDGQIAITTKNKEDGKENVITMSRGQLLRMGMAYNPVKLYEMNLAEAVDAEKQGAKARADIAKEDRTFNRDIEKMTIEKQLDAANVGAKERRAMNTKIEALRAAGYSEDFINRSMPAILGIGDKKATSPDEARRLAYADRLKSDPMFGRKSKEERDRIISEDMGIVFAGGKPSDMPAAPAPATPAAAGLPKAGKGIPVFDTKTNTIIYK